MKRCRSRCVYTDKPIPEVKLLPLRKDTARVVVIVGCNYYVFAFKEEAKEFLRQKFGVKGFEIRPCPE